MKQGTGGLHSRAWSGVGRLLAALFLTGVKSITHVFTGHDVFAFVERWGGWISLAAFAVVANVLIRIPVVNSTSSRK